MPTIIDALNRFDIATRRELADYLGVSQAGFSRLFRAHAERIAQIGRGRAVRYALRSSFARVETPVPVYRVSPEGKVGRFGELEPLSKGRFLIRDAVFEDLPWFLWDMRPQGFIGRAFAHSETALRLPTDLQAWQNEDILLALTRRGEDCSGDLVAGHEALERYLALQDAPVAVSRADYAALAHAAVLGDVAGSSAAGEQPKFTAMLAHPDACSVIVKFSPPVRESPAARRFADLLICEHLALTVMREQSQDAAVSAIVETGGRVMLETRRFDRSANGRRALLSGTAIDAQFVGVVEPDWAAFIRTLCRKKRIDSGDRDHVLLWHAFGLLIGNSDMHLGNLSFFTEDYRSFTLASAYDMLPMRWSPARGGEIVERQLDIPLRLLDNASFETAAVMAEDFWCRVRGFDALERRFSAIADAALLEIARVRRKVAKFAL
ncbi:type II toxin-antitoxin system HipA family toxin YjjJ [Candidatus Methylospira mobilis]|uniref:type II toxin-antitoxin system HipA family toxin YjjJ n=1 Tax=Candidatus Methylospira mobilis TaxID=1808979 RepID=UPI0028E4B20E|nr:type II toxin-antitoxin system HipA family toxin YjjJ [Candidatus Methylospira mobilis]WNV03145.1 type II toxin-antitoxin system HipA family toxin YjjJ [Candidatus Methylospira mobilis]